MSRREKMRAEGHEAYEVIKNQFYRDLEVLKELARELELPVSGSELLKYSGLIIGEYVVKRKYHYYKLMGVLTGDEADRVERWLMRKENETSERERTFRRKTEHLLNLKRTEENRNKLLKLAKFWRRAKALQKWLEVAGN
jgi:hypothetical protein